jgi:hypothetical protein
MPKRKTGKVGLAKGASDKVNQTRLTIKKPTITRVRTYIKRGEAWTAIRTLGQTIGTTSDVKIDLPKIVYHKDMRDKFFSRVFDDGVMVKNSIHDGRYRTSWGEQDKLLSTASVRNLILGLVNKRKKSKIPKEHRQLYNELIDLCSSLRIPTKFSGFATSKGVMQHPTAEGSGFFSTKKVDGPHGSYDVERVKYIGEAVRLSKEANESLSDQARAMVRAAIEFSLNYFTAPITAKNVQPFSTKKGVSTTDESLLEQIKSRERIKDIYVKLGGKLRTLESEDDTVVEEPEDESLTRDWQRDLKITTKDPFPFAQPSPRRERRAKKTTTSVPDTKLPVGSGSVVLSKPFSSSPGVQQSTSSGPTGQGVFSMSGNALQQNTLKRGVSLVPKLNLSLLQPMQMQMGDVLPLGDQTVRPSLKRKRSPSLSDTGASTVLFDLPSQMPEVPPDREPDREDVFDDTFAPLLSEIDLSDLDFSEVDRDWADLWDTEGKELSDGSVGPLGYGVMALPLKNHVEDQIGWPEDDVEESGWDMFDPGDLVEHDFVPLDDFAEHDLMQFGFNTLPGEMQMVQPMPDVGQAPGFGMDPVDEMLLQLPDVPTHPIGDDVGDLEFPMVPQTVPGNVMGEGSVSGVVEGEGDGLLELLAL